MTKVYFYLSFYSAFSKHMILIYLPF